MKTLVLTLSLPDIDQEHGQRRAYQVTAALTEYCRAVGTNNLHPDRAPPGGVGMDGNGTLRASNGVVIREGMS